MIQARSGIALNKSSPLCRNLEICYPLLEGGGKYINDVVKGLAKDRGQLLGSTPPAWGVMKGMPGLNFVASSWNGSYWTVGGYIQSAASDSWMKNSKGITCSFWYKLSDTGGQQRIINYWDSSRGYIGWLNGGNMSVTIDTRTQGGSSGASTATGVDTTNLHHYCFTYDGANIIIYIDGIERNRTAWTEAVTTSTAVNRIGSAEFTSARYYYGFLANIGLWSRAITSAEVKQLYLSPYGHFLKPSFNSSYLVSSTGGFFMFM